MTISSQEEKRQLLTLEFIDQGISYLCGFFFFARLSTKEKDTKESENWEAHRCSSAKKLVSIYIASFYNFSVQANKKFIIIDSENSRSSWRL